MCLIIDANCCHKLAGAHEDAKPIHKWIMGSKGKIATGGKNLEELRKAGLGSLLIEYQRASHLVIYDPNRIDVQKQHLAGIKLYSNDEHIILLARVSGSRLVFTKDKLLKKDLRNLKLVPRRNGSPVQFYSSKIDQKKLFACPSCH